MAAKRSDLEQVLADKVPARIAGATVGLVLGGPIGALIGTGISPWLEYILNRGNERYVNSAELMIATAADAAELPIADLAEYLEQNSARLEAATAATRMAMDTLDRQKLTALARVLAYGLTDDARLDMTRLYLITLRDLEAAHIRVLELLTRRAYDGGQTTRLSEMRSAFPGLVDGLHHILAVLERNGLVEPIIDINGGNAAGESPPPNPAYRVESFGRAMFEWLRIEGLPA